MNSISLISSIAMAVGLAAALPQILRMVRTRSSAGQSVLGWGMGLVTNLSMGYVNLFGFHAASLMASNVLSAVLCVAAMALILRFGPGAGESADHGMLIEMPTTEFVALREAVQVASERRGQRPDAPGERALAAQAA